ADWVSLKVDTIAGDIWHKINGPHRELELDRILQGMSEFSRTFSGELTTETMLVRGVNDDPDELERTADFIAGLKSKRSYVSIPTRPPTERWVDPPTEEGVNVAYQIFSEKTIDVEYLIGYEGNAFAEIPEPLNTSFTIPTNVRQNRNFCPT
ncbi:MAG: hypothetical protein KAW09_01335, partial [Thermoplasmata archaeon]|nr:hypothetical protein [Thermoplasmata archaeon]